MSSYVSALDKVSEADAKQVGGKAANLAKLLQANLPVPIGVAVGLTSFDDNGKLNEDAAQQVKQNLAQDKLYAVRSSALAEDAEGASWAGQFETYLDTNPEDVIAKIELCHNSAKSRAKAYAEDKASNGTFDIAVVIQEMVKPEYAGVLFTKDPVTGKDQLVTEYVEGLGEGLVSGKADPKHLVLNATEATQAPFDTAQLADLAQKVEQLFGVPQDIEWAWADNKMWLVQARPITTTQESRTGYHLGEPDDLFYWGPSRATPKYMSDFMAAVERFFIYMANEPELPNPPKTIALFHDNKNVWLINAQEFAVFTEKTFEAYEKQNRLNKDIADWQVAVERLSQLNGTELTDTLVEAWYHTEFAEFSLYGAETALIKRLGRYDASTRQEIWGAFTVPDKPTFLARIDSELAENQNPEAMAKKYDWIQDGYEGVNTNVAEYFVERLKVVGNDKHTKQDLEAKRVELTKKLELTRSEVNALTLARKLAEFMDDRKAWMMQTRRLINKPIGDIEHGWFFCDGKVSKISQADTRELWQRYVDFKSSTNAVIGIVASNGGKHFINGEVTIVTSPTDVVEDGKIVVVPSTSPSYVPLMRKAKALVTDHGGMMSHAAIVAREFNLPCIVGTKQATKVLKNGDKVVLDLVLGEVNK
jgi:phosphohistidine swiveling domain-containing protein